jgi:hypothetical protein
MNTETTALTVIERASIALGTKDHEARLTARSKQSRTNFTLGLQRRSGNDQHQT